MEKNHKLGIIVPYRNRPEQLRVFQDRISSYLSTHNIDYEIIIVSQDNGKLFNRGMLLNIGFKQAQKLKCDYVVFHDVDMLPVEVDYSYSDKPLHLATKFLNDNNIQNLDFDQYFGGVTLFPSNVFKKINGYSNKYWGWGFEDDDLLLRCIKNNVELDKINIKSHSTSGKILSFNGVNSYVKCKNNINLNDNITIYVSFHSDESFYNVKNKYDNYSIFSIPGYDTALTYNSFLRYNFCTFDRDKNPIYFNTKIKTNYSTNIIITLNSNDKIIKMYQDGILVDEKHYEKRLLSYKNQPYFYLGAGDINRKDEVNFFKGWINKFIVYSDVLSDNDISLLSDNIDIDVDKVLYYDANNIEKYKLVDLSGNNNDGKIYNCEILDNKTKKYKVLPIPYRRDSIFMLQPHENCGFENNQWKTEYTRWNQLRFHNEVLINDELLFNDGLSDLKYTLHGCVKNNKITHLDIGL